VSELVTYERHPLSAAFGDMSEDEYQDLKDSLENIGLQNPIVMFEGRVIDGWHRYKACEELGVPFTTVELGEDQDPQYYVISTNTRRNQTKAQKAISLSEVYAWGRHGDNQHKNRKGTEYPSSFTSQQIAEEAGVSEKTIKQAKAVITKAVPELINAVKNGEIGLTKAAQIAKLPKSEQATAIDKPLPKKSKPAQEPVTPPPGWTADPSRNQPDDEDVPEYSEVDQLRDQVTELQAEVIRLTTDRAIEDSGLDEEGKLEVRTIIDGLKAELKQAQIERDAMRASRDGFQREVAELKKQCAINLRRAERAEKALK